MYLRWIILILIVLALAPFALAEKTPAMDSSPHAVLLGAGLGSNIYQTPAALPARIDSQRIWTLTTSDPVSAAAPLMMADKNKKPPHPPPVPKPKPKSKSKDDKDKDDKDERDKG